MLGIEWIQCRRLYDAIQAGLVHPIPKRKPHNKNSAATSTENDKSRSGSSGSSSSTDSSLLSGLGLHDIILDDGDDDEGVFG